ncbi:MAG: ABC transporter substrate-binding protein, partial [Candidatus Hodarchaeales archaeon]
MIDYNANHHWSPLCRKEPKRRLSSLGTPFPYSKPIVILAILALAALGGGIFLETQSKKSVQSATTATEMPDPYFRANMLVPTYKYLSVQGAYIISENLRQIGIGADITLVGWGQPFGMPNQLGQTMAEDSTGRIFRGGFDLASDFPERFDLALWPRAPDILEEWSLTDYYHSPTSMSNGYPIDLLTLDELLNTMQNATDLLERRPLLLQALGQILWDIQAVTGIYDAYDPFALDVDIRNFDPDRWALGFPNLPEMYFASSNQTSFVYAGQHQRLRLNPAYSSDFSVFPRSSPYLPANYISNLVFSRTYELDRNLALKPIFAADFPVTISSDDLIPATGLTPDSPYFGKEGTPWGPNPTINSSQYNAHVEADDNSMFLLRLREEIPWQPGYGYTPEMKLNVTADDLVWTFSYLLNSELTGNYRDTWRELFGANFSEAIEKINSTTVKINLRGPLGDGQVANWFEALAIPPLPRHILDPTFNATPYGGKEGQTPDGTVIRSYRNQYDYRYNTGEGTNPVVSCGPYYVEGVDTKEETIDPMVQSRITLKKFSDWGGRGARSLWNDPQFMHNNIESYSYEVYGQWKEVKAAFLHQSLL